MSPEEIRNLLGGYATGTLTEAEQRALFAAALEDQELFDALVKEQPLRELLGDPAARAELLHALDVPSKRSFGFLEWLRHPMVATLAAACVVTVAAVAVWQGARVAAVKPAPMIVAELRPQTAPVQPPAEVPAPPAGQNTAKGANAPQAPPPARRLATRETPPPVVTTPASGMPALALSKDKLADTKTEKDNAPPAAAPTVMAELSARNAKAEAESATAMTAGVQGKVADARTLFYTNQAVPAANAFAPRSGSAGGAASALPQADATARAGKSVAGFVAPLTAAALRLGVRVSILRGDREVDLTTPLDPGETVRLKLTPNSDGFLYVVEGARLVVSGPAVRLKPLETPELHLAGSGRKQLYVILSRGPRAVDPSTVGSLARDLVETTAAQDRATYVVSGERDAASQQVVVPVTLTWR